MLEKKLSEMEEELKVKEIFLIIETRFLVILLWSNLKLFQTLREKSRKI